MDTEEVWETEGSQEVHREMTHEMFERQRKTMPRKRRRRSRRRGRRSRGGLCKAKRGKGHQTDSHLI